MSECITALLFALIRASMGGKPLSPREAELLQNSDALTAAIAIAEKHDLAQLVTYAMAQNGVAVQGEQNVAMAELKAIYRYEQHAHALDELRGALEAARIPFMPLKGSVIRTLYPEPWMRTSCDIDILVHEEDLKAAISALTALGWIVKGDRQYHDISLYSPTGVHLELHFNIRENINTIDGVLDRVWEFSAPVEEGKYEHRQQNAYLIFHLLAHMSYHFVSGGCGIRTLADVWLVQQKLPFEAQVLRQLCAEASLSRFYECVCQLINVWFERGTHTPLTQAMEQYIISGGVYGTQANHTVMQQAKKGGKLRYILSRIFMPYDTLKHRYPVLKRHKWLYPLMQVRRWFSALLGGRAKNMGRELKVNKNVSRAQVSETTDFLSEIGL